MTKHWALRTSLMQVSVVNMNMLSREMRKEYNF